VHTPDLDVVHDVGGSLLCSDQADDRRMGSGRARSAPEAFAPQFGDIALPHLDAAYVYALRLTRHREMAEDVVQDAFIKAFIGFGSLKNEDARPWLFKIVRHHAFDWMKREKRRSTLSLGLMSAGECEEIENFDLQDLEQESPEDAAIRNCEVAKLHKAIGALPLPLVEVVVLRELEGLSYRKVSQAIDAPIGTVMSRLFRAHARLGELLQSRSDDFSSIFPGD